MRSWIRPLLLLAVMVLTLRDGWATPEVKVLRPKESATINEPYRVICEITWSGKADLVVFPAKVESIDWGAVQVETSESSTRNGMNVVAQTVAITPAKAGDFQVPEILIPYRNPEDLTPPETSTSATHPTAPGVDPTLRAEPFLLHVRPDMTLAWVSGGLGVLLLCLGLGWRAARKRRTSAGPSPSSLSSLPTESAALESARRNRLDGQPYEFYLSLNAAVSSFPEETDLIKRIRERAQAVGYQGVIPTDAQMNADYEAVERVLARKPHEEARLA